jgi:hypothetical protein
VLINGAAAPVRKTTGLHRRRLTPSPRPSGRRPAV